MSEVFAVYRSFKSGVVPPSLARGQEFVNVADGFRLIGDGTTSPAQLPRIAFKPADQLPISQAVASALNGKANASDLLGVLHTADLAAALTAVIAALPTTLPSQPGVLWNNGGVVQIS